ncbi:MAG: hypothetical protein CMO55_07455 [Verrucomicrobiales bacterium]|nr:hypothetical protein [Verrucomicrobiales bacterium]
MTNHKTASIILIVLIAGMLYGVNQLRNVASTKAQEAETSRTEADTAEQQAQLAQIQLKTIESKTAQLRSVFEEWEPHFKNCKTPQDAEQKIAEVIREGDVFLISQKFDSRDLDKEALVSKAVVADLIVEDEYSKTLNWLGRLEESLPSCRITKCNLTRGDRGNNIHLELQVQIPVVEG